MSKPMKRSAFFFSATMVGLLAVYAPSSWSSETHEQPAQKSADAPSKAKSNAGTKGAPQGMDHGSMRGMDHGAMKGMDHGSMQGMDHSKMMDSHGGEKTKAGKDDQ